MSNSIGQLLSFVDLLQFTEIDKICIPVIQRDYAQGRTDIEATEIRNDFVSSMKNALESNQLLTLDCVYGSIKGRSFIPIDGQQRLTTLFLLHYYISVAVGKLASALLKKFTYEVRDSAKEFCESLAANSIELSKESPSSFIKNALWYHGGVYDNDPTIVGMLRMLDEIHTQFGIENAADYYDKLFISDPPIKFWWLSIDNFGFADDLFIKMNARGKSLTRFEMFKSEFETAATVSCNSAVVDEWKEKIDNEWLEFFWRYFGADAPRDAENGLLRYIIFIGDTFYSWREKRSFNSKNLTEESDKIQYRNAIEVLQRPSAFEFLCESLNKLEQLYNSNIFSDYRVLFKSLAYGNSLDFWKYAKLFSIIDYSVKFDIISIDSSQFERLLNNLLASQREINKRDMVFNTSIDGANYYSFTKGIDELLVQINVHNGDVLKALREGQNILGLAGHSAEALKARLISQNFQAEILSLEQMSELRGLIHNFIEPDRILFSADKLSQVIKDKMTFLQLFQSYSPNEMLLLRVGYLWSLVLGKDESKSFKKHRLWFNNSEYGDFLLTAAPGDTKKWQAPLKALISDLSILPYNNITNEMAELLQRRIDLLSFKNWFDYIVKYPEFFVTGDYCCCMIPEYTGGTGYWCLVSDKNWQNSYNPFCKALARKLNVPFKIHGDIKNILKLPGNVTAEIMSNGNWCIITKDKAENVVDAAGKDCIEEVYNYLTSHFDFTA